MPGHRGGGQAARHRGRLPAAASCLQVGGGAVTDPRHLDGAAPFDRAALARNRSRAVPANFLLDHVAGETAERLAAVLRRFEHAVEIGSLSGQLRAALGSLAGRYTRLGPLGSGSAVVADEEALPLAPAACDLLLSSLSLQAVNDLPGALVQARRALRPDGLFLAALAGGSTLAELRQAFAEAEAEMDGGISPRVFPFAELRDLGALLQRAGFALPVADSEILTVRYDSAFALMAELRALGAANALVERRRTPTRRATLLRMAEIYARRFSDPDGRIRATVELVWLSGWAPHESQPAPLRPGSARTRLADALGVREGGLERDEAG